MPLEDILKRIEEEAESRKNAILESARKEAKARREKARLGIEKEVASFLEHKRREAELEAQRIVAEARLRGRNELARVKQEALQNLRKELEARLLDVIEKQYESWWKHVLRKAVEWGDEEVWMFPEEAKRLGTHFIEALNNEFGYRLSFGGILESASGRGFLLKRGGMTIDVSLQALLEDFFRRNERDIALALFQGVEA
ncbi:V-type ATP synthase subunit E [Candidatus Caldatribacterium sp.]|uniref:V-type ATP synthase subunit E n=1 Tax=Candidatus Caldatribacterium sp. TaxID=2282143 RepID=UPI0029915B5D|nr:V-type ATP synthase subunit E [Candidatus Caldatribacterium sp.]MDW8081366.1 V-type ATP synthase subunit E [Candidatus Calescibacterium sp.]